MCLKGVWRLSERSLEGNWKVSALEGVFLCLECVLKTSERNLEVVCKVPGRCPEGVWKLSGR